MTDTAIALSAPLTLPTVEAEDEKTAHRADALHNALRFWNARHVLAKISLIGPLLIALSWLNRQFWAAWVRSIAVNGRPSAEQWILMVLTGQFARPFTNLFGAVAERSIEKRRSALPKDHAHALAIDDPRLHHLSLLGTPVTVEIADHPEVIEFQRIDNEVHVLWGDRSACLWITRADDRNLITETNVSEPATDVIRRKGCIAVTAGSDSSHVPDENLGNILEEMDLGKPDVLCSAIESTSLSTNAAQTVRFELLT